MWHFVDLTPEYIVLFKSVIINVGSLEAHYFRW